MFIYFGIDVLCDEDGGVPEEILRVLRVHASRVEESGVGVAELMQGARHADGAAVIIYHLLESLLAWKTILKENKSVTLDLRKDVDDSARNVDETVARRRLGALLDLRGRRGVRERLTDMSRSRIAVEMLAL